MIYIKERPYNSSNDEGQYPDNTEDLRTVASGEDAIGTLQELVAAINADEVDIENNELLIFIV